MCIHILKIMQKSDFYCENSSKTAPHVQCYSNNNIKHDLMKNLTEHQCCFLRIHILIMHDCFAQKEILKCFMILQLNCSSSQAVVIRVNAIIDLHLENLH